MPRDLILHIGTSKTGSTSIQKVLARQRRALRAQGVFYPRSPGGERHELLAVAACTDPRRLKPANRPLWHGMDPQARLDQFAAEFAEEMAAIPGNVHRIVVSAEQFSMLLLDRQGVQNLHDMLAPYADRFTVVAYLRRPDQHFASLYSEMLRWGDARRPDLLGMHVSRAHDYDYAALLDRWASVFGADRVRPRLFERGVGKRFDVVDDFASVCGMTLAPASGEDARSANPSIVFTAQMVLVELAALVNGGRETNVQSVQWRNITQAATTALPGSGWRPTRQEAQAFVARYAERNETVRRRWFAERETLFSTDFSDLPEAPMVARPPALLAAALRIIREMGDMAARREAAAGARRPEPADAAEMAPADTAQTDGRQPLPAIAHAADATLGSAAAAGVGEQAKQAPTAAKARPPALEARKPAPTADRAPGEATAGQADATGPVPVPAAPRRVAAPTKGART